jgi:DNA-directed RNA polymerase specialized sigma24 family protein
VPDGAFQDEGEPYPGHWRHPPEPVPPARLTQEQLLAALADLPPTWRDVLLRHDGPTQEPAEPAGVDARVADELGLTLDQEHDILARARAALRDRLHGGDEAGAR